MGRVLGLQAGLDHVEGEDAGPCYDAGEAAAEEDLGGLLAEGGVLIGGLRPVIHGQLVGPEVKGVTDRIA